MSVSLCFDPTALKNISEGSKNIANQLPEIYLSCRKYLIVPVLFFCYFFLLPLFVGMKNDSFAFYFWIYLSDRGNFI